MYGFILRAFLLPLIVAKQQQQKKQRKCSNEVGVIVQVTIYLMAPRAPIMLSFKTPKGPAV